jgi:hypothetical protein
MKRARPTRKSPLDPTAEVRDLAVTPAIEAGVKGGEVKQKASPTLMLACASGQHIRELTITQ